MTQRAPTVELTPPGSRWASLIRRAPADAVACSTRSALGLPEDRAVVMGGHQPGPWHPGILAKWLAIESLVRQTGAAGAWVVVDQSAADEIAFPVRRGDALERSALAFAPGVPSGGAAAGDIDDLPALVTPDGGEGMRRYIEEFRAHRGARTLAMQLHSAAVGTLRGLLEGGPSLASFGASELHRTRAFLELVAAMRADPAGCADAYDKAVRRWHDSGVRELERRGDVTELPLWERTESGPWAAVFSDRLGDIPDERLAFRALPMTGLLRWRACDLFVHGTGGGATGSESGYDRVTEDWMRDWLGVDDLAPAVVATATMTLDFGTRDVPTPAEIAEARAAAHRAEHDPSLLGQADLGQRKRELAEKMKSLPRGSDERAKIFQEMQSLRTSAAGEHGEALQALRERAASLEERAAEAEIVHDRTWPFPMHSPADLRRLRSLIDAELTG